MTSDSKGRNAIQQDKGPDSDTSVYKMTQLISVFYSCNAHRNCMTWNIFRLFVAETAG